MSTTLLLLSDSHGNPENISLAIRRTRPDGILFAGDGLADLTRCDLTWCDPTRCDLPTPCVPLWAVRGNCDYTATTLILPHTTIRPKDEELVSVEGLTVLLMHGHLHAVKSGPNDAIAHAIRRGADVLVFGHTHRPVDDRVEAGTLCGDVCASKPLLVCNPGSIGDWRAPTFATLTVRHGVPLIGHGEL